jgi:hypothetical protein
MKNCKDTENNLPLYLDDFLSGEEKRAVEEHLRLCPKCAKVIAQLQKTGKLVDGLGEVEPPPWFKQKIMAKVRQEAEKKSFAPKWFYPMRIKVPVQIFATVFIVVIAVYIYRAGDEQFKEVMPPQASAPVMEAQKDQLSEQSTKVSAAITSTGTKAKVAAEKNMRDEKVVLYDVSSGAAAPKTRKARPQENVRAGATDMAKAMKEDVSVDKGREKLAALPAKQMESEQSMPPPGVAMERKREEYALGVAMKESRAPEAISLMQKATISMRVANINTAVGEVEKLLVKYDAKKIVKQMPGGKAILTAELKTKKMKKKVYQWMLPKVI